MSPEEKESLVRSIFPLPQFSIESNAQSYIYSTTTAQFLAVNGTLDVGVEMWRVAWILSDACRLLGRKKALRNGVERRGSHATSG